jgi:photosystem II stability/assembly factor-like uncharacterized protein
LNPSRAYCGTFGDGLWKTDNSGRTWDNIGKNGISISSITSVSVSPLKVGNDGFSKIYVGTEPSALYASSDGGESWERMSGLNKLGLLNLGAFLLDLGLIMFVGLSQM